MLLRFASSINQDDLIPLYVPETTIAFLRRLGQQCDHSSKPLGRFLLGIRSTQLADAVIAIVLPQEFNDLRVKIDHVQREKENAVASMQWESAKELKRQGNLLKDLIHERWPKSTELEPAHITRAISHLGFQDPIIVK